MHSKCEVGVNTNNNVLEDNGTSGVKLNGNDLLVGNAELLSVCGSHVDVSLCNDCAVSDLDLACGTNELETGGTCGVAALTDGGNDTECACIGEGKLNLICGANGAENAHSEAALGAYNGKLFVCASKLTGLGKHLLDDELCALAVKDLNCLCGEVAVTSRGFNDKSLGHFYVSPCYNNVGCKVIPIYYIIKFVDCKSLLRFFLMAKGNKLINIYYFNIYLDFLCNL